MEKEQNKAFAQLGKFYYPEMENPYYKWDGSVVDGKVRLDEDDETEEGGNKNHGKPGCRMDSVSVKE